MRTRASLGRFPIHPMLVVVALGALPTCVVFDALFVWSLDVAWYRAGFVATSVGALALLASMAPGFVDYFSSIPRRGEVWKHASVHMLFGVSLVGYFVASAVLRWATLADPGTTVGWSALAMNALGVVGLAAQSWTGRGLVLRHFVGVEKDFVPELPPAHPDANVDADRDRARRRRDDEATGP